LLYPLQQQQTLEVVESDILLPQLKEPVLPPTITRHVNRPLVPDVPESTNPKVESKTYRTYWDKVIDKSFSAEQFYQLEKYTDFINITDINDIKKSLDSMIQVTSLKDDIKTEKIGNNINIEKVNKLIQEYIDDLPQDNEIGLCIAGNSGKPAGGLSNDYMTIKKLLNTTPPQGQEENILSDWFNLDKLIKGNKTTQQLINKLFEKTIQRKWGLKIIEISSKDIDTIQEIQYKTDTEKTEAYFLVYAVKTIYRNKNNVHLLFTFAPNTQMNKYLSGSMSRTKDLSIKEDINGLNLYIKGLIAALIATILCAIKKNIKILILPYLGCGINAYENHKRYLTKNFVKFLDIASNIIFNILTDQNVSLNIIICTGRSRA